MEPIPRCPRCYSQLVLGYIHAARPLVLYRSRGESRLLKPEVYSGDFDDLVPGDRDLNVAYMR
jgi:hypothetical protein